MEGEGGEVISGVLHTGFLGEGGGGQSDTRRRERICLPPAALQLFALFKSQNIA